MRSFNISPAMMYCSVTASAWTEPWLWVILPTRLYLPAAVSQTSIIPCEPLYNRVYKHKQAYIAKTKTITETFCCKPKLFLSQHQTIDKVGQLFGRGLVSEDNRLMKSLNHDTCHLSHQKNGRRWGRRRFYVALFLTAKQHKKRTIWVRRWLRDR